MTGYGLQDSYGGCGMWKHASRSPQYRLRQNGYIGASWREDVVSTLISFTYMSGECVPLKAKKKKERCVYHSPRGCLSVLLLESNRSPWFSLRT